MKGFRKKIISLVISVVVISSTSLQIVSAKERNYSGDIKMVIKQEKHMASSTKVPLTFNVKNYQDFLNVIEKSVNKIDESIRIVPENGYLKNDINTFSKTLKKIISIVGTGRYIQGYEVSKYIENGKEIYNIKYKYKNGIEDARKKDNEVNKIVASIIPKIIKPNMSVNEKEKAIHDYIINNTKYDIENVEKNTLSADSHTPYGVFVKKVAVCDGYSSAMKKMLNAVNIENLIVVGEAKGVAHSWNLVKLNGKWHHVDATWDDPVYKINGKYKDIIKYDYFNKTDVYMGKTHKWIKADYPKAQ